MTNELIDRYIYAVTKRLPQKQRADIDKELRGLIDEMMAERGGDAEAVLLELGEPSALADKYRDKSSYLIGPEYFGTYFMVMRIVLAATAFGMTVAMVIGFLAEPPSNVFTAIGDYFSGIMSALFGGFAWVTVIFALIERYGDKSKLDELRRKQHDWKPSDLPPIPAQSARIRISEPIVGIVFNVIILIIFNFAYRWIGVYFTSSGGAVAIPIFNADASATFLPLVNVLFCLSILKECAKLAIGRWTLPLALVNIAINALTLLMVVLTLTTTAIWNQNFFTELSAAGLLQFENIDLTQAWPSITRTIIVFLTIVYVLDSGANLYKALAGRDSK